MTIVAARLEIKLRTHKLAPRRHQRHPFVSKDSMLGRHRRSSERCIGSWSLTERTLMANQRWFWLTRWPLCGAYVLWYSWQHFNVAELDLPLTCRDGGVGRRRRRQLSTGQPKFFYPRLLVRCDRIGAYRRQRSANEPPRNHHASCRCDRRQVPCNPPGNLWQRHRLASYRLHNERPCHTSPIWPFSARCAASRARPRVPRPSTEGSGAQSSDANSASDGHLHRHLATSIPAGCASPRH